MHAGPELNDDVRRLTRPNLTKNVQQLSNIDLDVAVVDQLCDHGHAGAKHSASPLEHYRGPQGTSAVRWSRIW
jgi:hypothetical protein